MTFSALLTGATAFLSLVPAQAQVPLSGRSLPLSVAVATEAINSCKANGYDVTATVVDVAGRPQVVLRGDHATIHTRESRFRKAYTIITLGPIFHVDVTSELLAMPSKCPPLAAQALANTSNVAVLLSGVAFKVGDEVIGGIGVGGSPEGDKDEAGAKAGIAKVRDLPPH